MDKFRSIAVGINRKPMGEIKLSINNGSFTAIADREETSIIITGSTYQSGSVLVGGFCKENGVVGSVIMRKTKKGYLGTYTYLDDNCLPILSRYEWKRIEY